MWFFVSNELFIQPFLVNVWLSCSSPFKSSFSRPASLFAEALSSRSSSSFRHPSLSAPQRLRKSALNATLCALRVIHPFLFSSIRSIYTFSALTGKLGPPLQLWSLGMKKTEFKFFLYEGQAIPSVTPFFKNPSSPVKPMSPPTPCPRQEQVSDWIRWAFLSLDVIPLFYFFVAIVSCLLSQVLLLLVPTMAVPQFFPSSLISFYCSLVALKRFLPSPPDNSVRKAQKLVLIR